MDGLESVGLQRKPEQSKYLAAKRYSGRKGEIKMDTTNNKNQVFFP